MRGFLTLVLFMATFVLTADAAPAPSARGLMDEIAKDLRALDATERAQMSALDAFFRAYEAYHRRMAGLTKAAERAAKAGDQGALLDATRQMQETQMSFNLQYLQLQSQMQHENRSYTAISNILKTKHDTVKNSISNIR